MLTGCDYTDGVENVGIVAAVEILSEFLQKSDSGIEPLRRFRDWWEKMQTTEVPPGTEVKARLRKLSCSFPPSFPDYKVFQAYIQPNVERSNEQFSWGTPDLENLREFSGKKMGWPWHKVEELLCPILKQKVAGNEFQMHISSFMVKLDKDPEEMKLGSSKRVEQALKRLRTTDNSSGVPTEGAKKPMLKASEIGKKAVTSSTSGTSTPKQKTKSQRGGAAKGKGRAPRSRRSRASKNKAVGKIKELKMSESSSSESD